MIEHILSQLAVTGWETELTAAESGIALDRGAQIGLLFTYSTHLDGTKLIELEKALKWDVVIMCPEGVDSSKLEAPAAKHLRHWYWDLKTGYVFPYPATKETRLLDLLAKLSRSEPVPLFSDKSRVNGYIPFVSYTLIGLITLMFILTAISGGLTNTDVLVRFGAKVNSLIQEGEIWRLLTSTFLHLNIFHLGFNLYALWALGPFAEQRYGHSRFIVIYLMSGMGGSAASYYFSPAISVGASGAIFGLLGALLIYSWRRPQVWKTGLGRNLVIIIAINLAFGFSQPGIDNYAHLGGLVTGIILGALFHKFAKTMA